MNKIECEHKNCHENPLGETYCLDCGEEVDCDCEDQIEKSYSRTVNDLKDNSHIPTSEVEQDIADTEAEIATMEREVEHLEKTPLSMRESKWDHMRASARRIGIEERKKFIEKLKKLLQLRQQKHEHK